MIKTILLHPIKTYVNVRKWVFSKSTWNNFYNFVSLPELKCMKTLAFIVSIIL